MRRDEAIRIVKPSLRKTRFEHTLRVAETAKILAKRFNEPEDKIELAAIFHDYCKYRPLDEMERIITNSNLPKDLLDYHHELWHGPVASLLIEQEYGITDKPIQNAIYYHTTGRANMSTFEMIIFLADYIEPGRDFPGLDEVRKHAESDLIMACFMALKNTIQHLIGKSQTIYPETFYAYNDFTKRIKRRS